jgi:hypothetical protein
VIEQVKPKRSMSALGHRKKKMKVVREDKEEGRLVNI